MLQRRSDEPDAGLYCHRLRARTAIAHQCAAQRVEIAKAQTVRPAARRSAHRPKNAVATASVREKSARGQSDCLWSGKAALASRWTRNADESRPRTPPGRLCAAVGPKRWETARTRTVPEQTGPGSVRGSSGLVA